MEHLLRNYFYIRSYLDGSAAAVGNANPTVTKPIPIEKRPFGQAASGQPWPFMSPNHAKRPMNGKKKARDTQELHVSILDLETVIRRLSSEDKDIVTYYYMMGYSLEDCARLLGLTSKGSMHRRTRAIVLRILRDLNSDKRKKRV